jgi:hypothetical protein
LCIAPSRDQAGIVLGYIDGTLRESPILSGMIKKQTSETISLSNGIVIDVRSASFRRLRGQTCVAAIADEASFWHDDTSSSNPDVEILNALRPSLGTTNGLLAVISSPYSRRGSVWEAYKNHYGPNADQGGAMHTMVAKGSTRDLNPSYPQEKIDLEYARDPAHAAAEYGAEFRTDIESFISIEAVDACIDRGVRERPYDRRYEYSAFCDPSGGSHDSFTLAIAHREGKSSVLDAIREIRPPFSPEAATAELAALCRSYRVSSVTGDRYSGEWVREQFSKHSVFYQPSEKTKSELYGELLPLINARTAGLLDLEILQRQLVGLERRTTRAGRDSIDHSPGGRDDISNAVAGALVNAIENPAVKGFSREIVYPRLGMI